MARKEPSLSTCGAGYSPESQYPLVSYTLPCVQQTFLNSHTCSSDLICWCNSEARFFSQFKNMATGFEVAARTNKFHPAGLSVLLTRDSPFLWTRMINSMWLWSRGRVRGSVQDLKSLELARY